MIANKWEKLLQRFLQFCACTSACLKMLVLRQNDTCPVNNANRNELKILLIAEYARQRLETTANIYPRVPMQPKKYTYLKLKERQIEETGTHFSYQKQSTCFKKFFQVPYSNTKNYLLHRPTMEQHNCTHKHQHSKLAKKINASKYIRFSAICRPATGLSKITPF